MLKAKSLGHWDHRTALLKNCQKLVPDALNFALATHNVGLARVLLEESSSLGADLFFSSVGYNITPLWAALVDGCAEVMILTLTPNPDN